MSNFLHKSNETFFIDLGLLVSTDLFVTDQIYRYLHRIDDSTDEFYKLKLTVESDGVGYDNLNSLVQLKTNVNPLLQYMANPNIQLADAYYNGILYDDSYTSDSYFTSLYKTSIGTAFKTLVKDTNLDKVYVYTPIITESLFLYIMELFPEKPKWNFVTGNKQDFLQEYECNNYFLEDVNSIKYLTTKRHIVEGSIYIPEYKYNMNPEIPMVLNSPVSVELLNKEYNLKLHSIKLPLF